MPAASMRERLVIAAAACVILRPMNPAFLGKFVRYLWAGRMGDAAAMKAAMFGGRAYPEIAARLRGLRQPFPVIDLDGLRAAPADSFGRRYVEFLDRHKLRPLTVSPEIAAALWPDHVLEARYPLLHDAFHVLLDFDTSLPGELGVWSFVSAQHYSPAFDRAASFGALLYPLVAPGRRGELREAAARGRALARHASCLIAEPMEEFWREPIDAVRARFGLGRA